MTQATDLQQARPYEPPDEAGDVQAWLSRLCERLSSAPGAPPIREAIVLWHQASDWLPVALWPAQAHVAEVMDLADQVREAEGGLISPLEGGDLGLGYPIRDPADDADAEPVGTLALTLAVAGRAAPEQAQLRSLMRWLEDGVAVLERDLVVRQFQASRSHHERLSHHLSLMAAVLEQPSFDGAAMQLTTRLADELGAERVSLGWRRGSRTRLRQISHSARFNRKMQHVRAAEAAMDEALDQRRAVVVPSHEDPAAPGAPVHRAHEHLAEVTAHPCLLSVPCLDDVQPLGCLTVERDTPFSREEVASLESLAILCTRALEEKRRNDRPLLLKVLAAGGQQLGRLLGAGHLGYKVTAIVCVGLLAFAWFATGTDSVSADATLESREQRVTAAPFRGYIEDARVRAGDSVERGDVLAVMDTRDLRLEQLEANSELAQLEGEAQQLRAEGERASLNVVAAQREQAEARLDLIQARLERSTLRAPFDGVVVEGDLTQRLGSAVDQGDELFRLAPSSGYRVELEVNEARIDDLREGQRGELVLSAMTGRPIPLEVTRLTPETRQGDGSNRFVIEAELEAEAEGLRPGMQGVGKVDVGEERLINIWTRRLVDWLRLQAWKWWG